MYAGRQSVIRMRSQRQRFSIVVEYLHRQHRAEDFTIYCFHAAIYTGQDGRQIIRAVAAGCRQRAARDQLRAGGDGTVDDAVDAIGLALGNDGSQRSCLLPGRPRLQRIESASNASYHLFCRAALHDQARAGDADLAGIAGNRSRHHARYLVQIGGVGKHDLRALAAQFQRYRLGAAFGASPHDRDAGLG